MAKRTDPGPRRKVTNTKSKANTKSKSKSRSKSKSSPLRSAATEAAPAVPPRGVVPFPKKDRPPSEAEFLARIPVATGRKLEALRTFLGKQRGVTESLFYFGPRTGWAYRYLRGEQSVATLMLHAGQLVGIVALDRQALSQIDFATLSPVATAARQAAHGSPSLSWLDLPLDGPGAADFKVLVKTKLLTLAPPPPPRAPPHPPSSLPTRARSGPGRARPATRPTD